MDETPKIKIEFDINNGRLVYEGPREDLEDLLRLLEDAGIEYRRHGSASKVN